MFDFNLGSMFCVRPSRSRLPGFLGACSLAFCLASTGCIGMVMGDGEIVQESRPVTSDISQVWIEDGFELEFNIDPTLLAPTLTIQTDSNLLEYAKTQIEGTRLRVYNPSHHGLHATHGVHVWLSLPSAHELHASGGASALVIADQLPHLEIDASGGSEVRLEADVTHLEVEASGGSEITLTGVGDTVIIHASGGSDIHSQRFESIDGQVRGSGGSAIQLCATQSIAGELSGGSSLDYFCQPSAVNVAQSGGSRVAAGYKK